MKIVFRVDASMQIGTGHVMRCLTLADALAKHGNAEISFICRYLPASLEQVIKERGFKLYILPVTDLPAIAQLNAESLLAHSSWLGVSQEQDAKATLELVESVENDWMVVDHYALDIRWERILRPSVKKLMVIDDLADRSHDCDLLLDQNFYSDMNTRYTGKVPQNCQLLLGPRYALLREEFNIAREQLKPRTGEVKRILIFFGGVDTDNYTSLTIQALSALPIKGINIDVVIGTQHPRRLEIEQSCAFHGYECHVQTLHMAELMASADLAIGAGGSATWERCCLGLPALSICTAENQRRQIADAAQVGMLYAPSNEGEIVELLRRHTECLLENPFLLKMISISAKDAVDGRGVLRIIRELKYANLNGVTVRQASADDAVVVWPWRNSELTRRYFFDPSPVTLEKHLEWWNQSLVNLQRILLIGSYEGQVFGVIRYDLEATNLAIISIYLDPTMTGRGLGRPLLLAALDWLRVYRPETNTVSAKIISENSSSTCVFQSAGFSKEHSVFIRKV